MNLAECIKIGKTCGCKTLGEAYDNVSIHALNLFIIDEIDEELQELRNEIGTRYNIKEINTNIDSIII